MANTTEVIAKRKNGLVGLYGAAAALSLFVIILSFFCFGGSSSQKITGIFLLILGGLAFALCVVVSIGVCKTPADIIIYANGVLHFPEGSCNVSEIKNVEYRRASSRGLQYRWGTIILVLNDRTVKCNYVSDVVQVHNRLVQLMVEAKVKNIDKDNYGKTSS